MDIAQAWTFAAKHYGAIGTRETMTAQVAFRAKLRQAERFVLDDNAVRLVCRLTHEQQRLAGWSFLARLPYDTLWIEFDLHTKLREFEAMGTLALPFNPDQVARRLGLLLYRDEPDSSNPRWVCREFYDFGNIPGSAFDNQPALGTIAYVFDPEGDPMWPVRGSKLHHQPTLSLLPNFPRAPVMVTDPAGQIVHSMCDPELILCGVFKFAGDNRPDDEAVVAGSAIDAKTGELVHHVAVPATKDAKGHIHAERDIVAAPDWFTARAAVIVDPWWLAESKGHTKDHARAQFYRHIMMTVMESRGMMRWVVSLLAAINGLPRDVKPIQTRTGRRLMGVNMLPYLRHNSLTITLPRDDRVVWARKHLDRQAHNAQRAWHKVLGHWRVVERGKPVLYLCRHLPTMVENGLGICERCEMLIRWIKPHERGDINIGKVEHEYQVTAPKVQAKSRLPWSNRDKNTETG